MTLSLKKFPSLKIEYQDDLHDQESNIMLNLDKNFIGQTNTIFYNKPTHPLNALSLNNNKQKNGYTLEIIFHGLNFNAKRLKMRRPSYFIDVHKSEIFVFNENASNTFKSRIFKRRLCFFSFDQQLIHEIYRKVTKLKLPNIYTGKGLFSRTDKYTTKKGKKKSR
jgi:hypothetical protein